MAAEGFGPLEGLANRLARYRQPSVQTRAAVSRVDRRTLEAYLAGLGDAEAAARHLDDAVDEALGSVLSLSSLSAPLSLDYLERLSKPIPALTPEIGVQLVGRAYLAHVVVESDPGAFGAGDIPVLGTLPPLRRGRAPQDLLTRVVKASRRNFELIRAVSTPVWDGFVRALVWRVHELVAGDGELLSVEVVDGLARFGWVLRQVDLHYGLEPERR